MSNTKPLIAALSLLSISLGVSSAAAQTGKPTPVPAGGATAPGALPAARQATPYAPAPGAAAPATGGFATPSQGGAAFSKMKTADKQAEAVSSILRGDGGPIVVRGKESTKTKESTKAQ